MRSHVIALTVLGSIAVTDVIIAIVFLIARRRRLSREEEWRRELHRSVHPKLKNRYPD